MEIEELILDAERYRQLLEKKSDLTYYVNETGMLMSQDPELADLEERFQQFVPPHDYQLRQRLLNTKDDREAIALIILLRWAGNFQGVALTLLVLLDSSSHHAHAHDVHPWALKTLRLLVLLRRATIPFIEDVFAAVVHRDRRCQNSTESFIKDLLKLPMYLAKIAQHKITIIDTVAKADDYGIQLVNEIFERIGHDQKE